MINTAKSISQLNSKRLFLIDGIGAVLSAILLGLVLVEFESFFGIPASVLYFLAVFPVFFAIYDFFCYSQITQNTGPYLKAIAVANLVYCGLSLVVLAWHIKTVTLFGWIYILGEIAIVVILATLELKVARRKV